MQANQFMSNRHLSEVLRGLLVVQILLTPLIFVVWMVSLTSFNQLDTNIVLHIVEVLFAFSILIWAYLSLPVSVFCYWFSSRSFRQNEMRASALWAGAALFLPTLHVLVFALAFIVGGFS